MRSTSRSMAGRSVSMCRTAPACSGCCASTLKLTGTKYGGVAQCGTSMVRVGGRPTASTLRLASVTPRDAREAKADAQPSHRCGADGLDSGRTRRLAPAVRAATRAKLRHTPFIPERVLAALPA